MVDLQVRVTMGQICVYRFIKTFNKDIHQIFILSMGTGSYTQIHIYQDSFYLDIKHYLYNLGQYLSSFRDEDFILKNILFQVICLWIYI